MAKFCPNCGNEMLDEAVMCVKCGTMVNDNNKKTSENKIINDGGKTGDDNKKKKGLPAWAIVLIVFGSIGLLVMLVIVAFTIVGVNILKKTDHNEIKDKINDYIEENTKSLYGTIGDTLTDDEFKITLTGAYMYNSIGDGSLVDTPGDGKEYLLFFFDVENISDEDEFISYYDFDGYVDDVACDTTIIFNDVDGIKNLSANLASGKKAQGFVAFEVDKDWKDFEISYKQNFSDKSLIFKVTNSEGA